MSDCVCVCVRVCVRVCVCVCMCMRVCLVKVIFDIMVRISDFTRELISVIYANHVKKFKQPTPYIFRLD